MKVSELTGEQLNDWVAKAEGWFIKNGHWWSERANRQIYFRYEFKPCYDWHQGGQIIDRKRIGIHCVGIGPLCWEATIAGQRIYGDSPLEAAMRAYVASKFGDEVME